MPIVKRIALPITLSLFTLAILVPSACTSARHRPSLSEPSSTTLGQKVFMTHCNQCHPGGESGTGPALNNKKLAAFMIKTQVRFGFGSMPAFSKKEISKEQLRALVDYVKSLRKNPAPQE